MRIMRIIHSLLICFLLGTSVVLATTGFIVHEGKVYDVTTESVEADDVGTAIGEVTVQSEEVENGASNVFPVGTFFYDINGLDRGEAIAVEESSGQFVKAVYTQTNGSGFSIWTILLGIVGILVILVGMMSFRNQRNHVKQYKE